MNLEEKKKELRKLYNKNYPNEKISDEDIMEVIED